MPIVKIILKVGFRVVPQGAFWCIFNMVIMARHHIELIYDKNILLQLEMG